MERVTDSLWEHRAERVRVEAAAEAAVHEAPLRAIPSADVADPSRAAAA